MNLLPLFYFPTTVICVDDKELPLETFKFLLKDEFKSICYTDTKSVINYLDNYKSPLDQFSFINKVSDSDDNYSTQTIQLDISKIINLINLKDKYNEVSILLTDYHMPSDLDGLELCKLLKNHKLKKMLLTQVQDYSLAKSALNSGVIDFFANKSDSSEQIKQAVQAMALKYFCDLTANLNKYLEVENISPLGDSVFVEFFNNIIKEHNILEYYLIDKNGSYLLIGPDNKKYVLIVHNDQSLSEFTDLLDEYDNLADTVKLIHDKKYIPFFGVEKGLSNVNVLKMNDYLFDAQLINGKQNYYVHFTEYKF